MENFSVKSPLKGEFFTTIRLTVGGICALAGFDVDLAEDFKVCVTESLLILNRNGFSEAELHFCLGEALGCRIVGCGLATSKVENIEDEISRALLSALVGEVRFVSDGERVTEIAFEG